MPDPIPPNSFAAIRTLFSRRLAETNRDLIHALADLALLINCRDHDAILTLLGDVENRIQSMRNIVTVCDEHLER